MITLWKCAIVNRLLQDEVRARYRQQHAGHTADREGHDKADGPHHCGMEDDTALIWW